MKNQIQQVIFDAEGTETMTVKQVRDLAEAIASLAGFKRRPPFTVAVLVTEGDAWAPFDRARAVSGRVHAIKFEDGSIWDAHNGWRAS